MYMHEQIDILDASILSYKSNRLSNGLLFISEFLTTGSFACINSKYCDKLFSKADEIALDLISLYLYKVQVSERVYI